MCSDGRGAIVGVVARASKKIDTIGWREWVGLPEFDVSSIKAKIDTGARTSALHAFRLQEFDRDGSPWVTFEVQPEQRTSSGAQRVEQPVVATRRVRSSDGVLQRRPVIRTDIELYGQSWPIEITLTNRDEMGFRMLIGRAALRRRFLVDSAKSFVAAKPTAVDAEARAVEVDD